MCLVRGALSSSHVTENLLRGVETTVIHNISPAGCTHHQVFVPGLLAFCREEPRWQPTAASWWQLCQSERPLARWQQQEGNCCNYLIRRSSLSPVLTFNHSPTDRDSTCSSCPWKWGGGRRWLPFNVVRQLRLTGEMLVRECPGRWQQWQGYYDCNQDDGSTCPVAETIGSSSSGGSCVYGFWIETRKSNTFNHRQTRNVNDDSVKQILIGQKAKRKSQDDWFNISSRVCLPKKKS
jgi:hypothetical protein